MERENRYLIFKRKDIHKYLNVVEGMQLLNLDSKVTCARVADDRPVLQAVVVEEDWPEYEDVWRAIAARVDGNPTDLQLLANHAAELSIAFRDDDKDIALESWRALPDHLQEMITDLEDAIDSEPDNI